MYRQGDQIEVKVVDCAGTIILHRPDHGNALTQFMLGQLVEALDDLYRERRVRAIILTGAGETFSEGMDVREMQDDPEEPASQHQWGEEAVSYRDVLLRMMEITKPIIAAVNGPALAGGAGLVAASDVVIASAQSSFGLPDPRRGLVAGVVAPLLCFRLGAGHAARLLLTSATISAQEAHALGIFHELVEPDKVWARAMQLAQECAAGAPEAIQLTKRLLFETVGEQLTTQLSAGAVMSATARTTEAAQEGIKAYLEQRPPKWK
jgi:enoyl-CoA hydratase/carnithine racemase